MSFMKETQTRRFFLGIVLFSVLLPVLGLLFTMKQVQAAKEILLFHDSAIAGSLLEQGVAPQVIASAIKSPDSSQEGRMLLRQLGYHEKTAPLFLPAVSAFRSTTLSILLSASVILGGILLIFSAIYLTRREQLYQRAIYIILQFKEGNFSEHLPRNQEGNLYQLFASVNNLASALQSKSDTEYKARIFLKNTITDISHQLKTPLAALTMYNEIILDEPENTAVITDFSQKTASALERMKQLILSLLKITRLDTGNVRFEKTTCPVAQLVNHSMEELSTRAACEQKQILVSGPADTLIACDLQWTGEALGNIIKNALDHTEAGGQILISWNSSPTQVRITVTDNGSGIAPEDMHHIFKRFYRSSHSTDSQGTGLGLPLAKAVVEGQGGILSVQSTLNTGTTFILSFLTKL